MNFAQFVNSKTITLENKHTTSKKRFSKLRNNNRKQMQKKTNSNKEGDTMNYYEERWDKAAFWTIVAYIIWSMPTIFILDHSNMMHGVAALLYGFACIMLCFYGVEWGRAIEKTIQARRKSRGTK